MITNTFAVKAEQQEKLLRSASFIVAEKVLFGVDFEEGLSTLENPLVESNEHLEKYIATKTNITEEDWTDEYSAKALTAICMFLIGNQLDNGWSYKPVTIDKHEILFAISSYDQGIIAHIPEDDNEDEVPEGYLSPYLIRVRQAAGIAEILCNYTPVAGAIIQISTILAKPELAKTDSKYIQAVLDEIEELPYRRFLPALNLFNVTVLESDYLDTDDDANYYWRRG